MSERTFDLEITGAWTTFGNRLSTYIAEMEDNDTLVVESRYDSVGNLGYAPAGITFSAGEKSRVRCEVPANQVLHPLRMLEPQDHEDLIAMGFHRPDAAESDTSGSGSRSFYLDVDRTQPQEMVSKALRVFDQMWNIAHPTFLLGRYSGRENIPAFDIGPERTSAHNPLRALVDDALERLLGAAPVRDNDGDIPLVRGEQITYVRVLEDDQYVEIFLRFVHSIADPNHAALVLSQLNQQWTTVKLIMVESSILGVARVDGAPFVPDHLLRTLRSFAELAEAAEELADELGGQPIRADEGSFSSFEPDDDGLAAAFDAHECHEFPPELMSILELDADTSEVLTADDIAEICGRDRDTILDYLRISQEQEAAWHDALTNALAIDGDDIELCTGEKRAWTQAIRHLRRALRVVVLPPKDKGDKGRQLDLFGEPD